MYTSRNDKYAWVYDRFKKYLTKSVLDVGADGCRPCHDRTPMETCLGMLG